MKRIIILSIAAVVIILSGCKKEISHEITYDAFSYSSTDQDGGSWKPIFLTSATQVTVPAPTDPSSPEYLNELAALKSQSASLTSEQQEKVDYWSTNGIVRWNEITSKLVAKYFLLPPPNADGTYPWPDPTKPDQFPLFPFSSPPYACRAYAYLSAGSFDALISAWYYKYQFNREAPSKYDESITTHLPVQDIPSYPSEDAVIAAFSRTWLTSQFPLEAEYIKQMAKDQEDSRLWAGLNVPSDIAAGDTLGKAIANIFIGRGKTDGMKNTLGNKANWDSITAAHQATGLPMWESLEVPPRQMLAPNFGLVKPWTFDQSLVTTTFRLAGPPVVGTPEFQTALDEVLDYSKNASKEEKEIAFKWDDGTSTYSPPGHWNVIAKGFITDAALNPLRAARVLAYMNMAIEDAGICVWDNKYHYFFPRPTNMNPDIKTLMGVPGFPSYPSGHSGFSAAAATVLSHFFPEQGSYFMEQAQEAAMSRLYGCIHYRFDSEDGMTLGQNVAEYAVQMAITDGAE